jgi:uncharacterized protein (DUF58 family)
MSSQSHISLRSRTLPALVFVFLILYILSPFDGWLILLVGFGGTWLCGYYWARSLANKLRLQREMRFGWAQVGDRLEERFTLQNRSWLPAPWVELIDHSTLPGHQGSRATGVGGNAENRWTMQSVCTQRGLFTLGPTSLYLTDPLGIYQIQIENHHSTTLMVTPPVIPLPAIEVAPGGRTGEGRPRTNALERTVSASGVRDYTPGDSLRWIHWPTTAHHDELFVRLFDGTPAADWWILLDTDDSVQIGEGADSTLEHSITLAASLADHGLRTRHAVGLASGGEPAVWLPPQEGDGQRWAILRNLALVSSTQLPFHHFLGRLKPSFGKYASLILITPNVSGSWLKALLPLIWAGAVPTVLLLDPLSFGGASDPSGLQSTLVRQGIRHYIITHDLLLHETTHLGRQGQWEWRVTPTGRAVAIQQPGDFTWKEL